MPFDIPSHEDRAAVQFETTLKPWVDAINDAILNGTWHNDNRFDYLHVVTDGKWIDERYFNEMEREYDKKFWIIEQHGDTNTDDAQTWHLRVFKKRRDD